MRALLSTIGSRGDVQPMVALALELKGLGQDARICAPPDFREWVESFGIPFVAIGPEVRSTAKSAPPAARTPPTPEQIRQMMEATVATQFQTIPGAAEACDVIVAANPLQIAARSVAERLGIPYVFAAYSPVTLPSVHHAPPPVLAWTPADPAADNRSLWAEDAQRWQDRWAPALNPHRIAAGQAPVADVRSHILTGAPWLIADPTLGPWDAARDGDVFQPGAWILPDARPLSAELEAFLASGDPPIYFGFGSIRAPQEIGATMVGAARALGRRAIVLRGWADVELPDAGPDCLSIGEVNQQALFRRVAAVVHHGGAGTTTTAAGAAAPHVVVPQYYDQHYWAERVGQLGIGVAHPPVSPTVESLATALEHTLRPVVAERARSVATAIRHDGAWLAARRVVEIARA